MTTNQQDIRTLSKLKEKLEAIKKANKLSSPHIAARQTSSVPQRTSPMKIVNDTSTMKKEKHTNQSLPSDKKLKSTIKNSPSKVKAMNKSASMEISSPSPLKPSKKAAKNKSASMEISSPPPLKPNKKAKKEDDDSRAKVRWNVEPRLSIMRRAVETVLGGANTTEVAGRFGIPARTLRRYVANEKRRQEGGGSVRTSMTTNSGGVSAKSKKMSVGKRKKKSKKLGPSSLMSVVSADSMHASDSPIAGPIQPLLRSNEMEVLGVLGTKRHRATSLELFLEALAPVKMKKKGRGHFCQGGKSSSKKGSSKSKKSRSSGSNRLSTMGAMMTNSRERLESFGMGRRTRTNSLELFNWALEQRTSVGLNSKVPETLTFAVEENQAAAARDAMRVPSIGISDINGTFTSPRYRRPSVDFNNAQDQDVFMSDAIFNISPTTNSSRRFSKEFRETMQNR